MRRHAVVTLLALVFLQALAACSPPIEPEPWVLPVPDDAASIVLPPIDAAAREGPSLELIEERVLGPESSPPLLLGSSPPRVAPGSDGTLAVLDGSNRRVLIVGPDGELRAEVGRPGQGPGEIGQALELIVANDVAMVEDSVNRRWNRWSLDGALLEGIRIEATGSQAAYVGDQSVVWRQSFRMPDGFETSVRRVDLGGAELLEFVRVRWPERTIDPPIGEISGTESDAWWVGKVPPAHAVGPDGTVYFSTHERYQIHAFAPDGVPRWALQRPREPLPLPQIEIDYHMELHARRFPRRTAAQVDWPAHQYALAHLAVDGHGHLYVFPYAPRGTSADEPRPVDVYSAAGEPLFSGTVSGRIFTTAYATYNGPMLEVAWQAAAGDHVWGAAVDAGSGEYEVVRYRLVEPF